eukprot:TRINITY_DN23174_c0_g1_i1.p1 TRINITY_DN23174_c0_g1~~TRINITY_DN23174_c0_g1_i1.p1  ORF type:complete len:281 (-),score=91.43 TRINITY_DN23174_c0_g1_i1:90-932(-)
MGPTGTAATKRSHSSEKKGGYKKAPGGKVKPPPPKGPLFLYFVDISEEDLARVAAAETKDEVRRLLKEFMKIDQSEGLATEILADLHYHGYAFCLSRNFSAPKISTFLSIMKRVLEECVERKLPVEEAFHEFKTWLLKHSVERPPQSVGIFAYEDTQAILEYVHGSFFRHYKLYMYVYMTRCDVKVRLQRNPAGLVGPPQALPLYADCEVDPKQQPEFAHIFRQSEKEAAEEALRKLHGGDKEDRAALIKRKVDEGVKKLMESFETQLKDQDERFKTMMG